MGKGDKSTKRGKIFAGSYGNARPQGASKAAAAPTAPKSARPAVKAPAKAAPRKKV
jgi:30S ribosomal protein S31